MEQKSLSEILISTNLDQLSLKWLCSSQGDLQAISRSGFQKKFRSVYVYVYILYPKWILKMYMWFWMQELRQEWAQGEENWKAEENWTCRIKGKWKKWAYENKKEMPRNVGWKWEKKKKKFSREETISRKKIFQMHQRYLGRSRSTHVCDNLYNSNYLRVILLLFLFLSLL